MSDTPKTDAQISVLDEKLTGYASYPDSKEVVPAEFAKELERRLVMFEGKCSAELSKNGQLLDSLDVWRNKEYRTFEAYQELRSVLRQIRDEAIAMDDSQRLYPAPTVILAEGGRRIKDRVNAALNPNLEIRS